jgi:hypothetical protein
MHCSKCQAFVTDETIQLRAVAQSGEISLRACCQCGEFLWEDEIAFDGRLIDRRWRDKHSLHHGRLLDEMITRPGMKRRSKGG